MNIQIFGKPKCFDTKKAERYFKERRIRVQFIDLTAGHGISRGELERVRQAVGLPALIDEKHPDAVLLRYLAYDADKLEKLLEIPRLIQTPIVRNGKQAT
ncbi:MAG: glutaredoxin domain-containing protein, partial [Evtepia sp.]